MRRVKVKICGLQEEAHVVEAAAVGADYVGLVFAESRRRVTPERAERLRMALDGLQYRPAVVGVFVNESPALVNAIVQRCRLDFVQLSGDESVGYCALMTRPILKTIRVFDGTTTRDIENQVEELTATAARVPVTLLLDTGSVVVRGGSGRTFDWSIARDVAVRHPVLVAGGLDSATVGHLVAVARPYGVDVSSGVETGGTKDTAKIRAFMEAVRKAEEEIENAEDITA
jgi:phosphoribosylanthranilate isomerase